MRLGFFTRLLDRADAAERYRLAIAQIVHAEHCGFDSAWVAQHHFHEDEGGLPPADLSRRQTLHDQPERGHGDDHSCSVEDRESQRVAPVQERRRLLLQLVDGRQELVQKRDMRHQVVELVEDR